MQISSRASLQAAWTSYVLLCVSLLVAASAAPAYRREGGRQDGVLLSLRSVRQRQDPDESAQPIVTTAAPTTTTDIAAARAREAMDIAWETGGKATEARAATSKLRSTINKMGAAEHEQSALRDGLMGTDFYAPQATNAEAQAKVSLTQALAHENEVKKILAQVDAEAFKAATKAAAAEDAKLEKEASAYFKSLLAKFRALADPGPPTAAQAAAKAAQPYIDVELRVGALVQYYNEKAIADLTAAQGLATQAKSIATNAQFEQKMGVVDMAQRHMMQAHMMVGLANMKKAGAWNIRKLVESLNMSIPSYQRAAQMAAAHALATFTGIQMEQDKAHAEMRDKISKTTRQVDEAFETLEGTLADAMQMLKGMMPEIS